MFNGINVRRLCKPLYNINSIVFEPVLGLLAGVLGVVVLLENNVGVGFSIIVKGFLKLILHDGYREVSIHLTLNHGCISNPILPHTAPHHHITTSKLHSPLYHPVTQPLPHLFPDPVSSFWPQAIDFGLSRPLYSHPVLQSPLLVTLCNVQPILLVTWLEKRSFLLHSRP